MSPTIVTSRDVEQALKKIAKENLVHINRLRVIVALERLVCRLEAHPILEKHLVFKGGFALLKTIASARFTRDVDALAKDIAKEKVLEYIRQALAVELQDGFWFGDMQVKEQMFAQNYGGYRFDCAFRIGVSPGTNELEKLPRIHLDIGFGDKIPGLLGRQEIPLLFPVGKPVSWLVYPLESILAEKLETICRRGQLNSRAKDIFDLIELFSLCENHKKLKHAIVVTFQTRMTPIPSSFFRFVSNLEQGIFKTAWKSIVVPGDKPSFNGAWKSFLDHLRRLDDIFGEPRKD